MAKLLLVSGDLMLFSRLQEATQRCGLTKTISANGSNAAARCDKACRIAIIDLQTDGDNIGGMVAELRRANPNVSIIAVGPHVHEQKLQQAEQAGCDLVVSRGQLDRNAATIIQELLA